MTYEAGDRLRLFI